MFVTVTTTSQTFIIIILYHYCYYYFINYYWRANLKQVWVKKIQRSTSFCCFTVKFVWSVCTHQIGARLFSCERSLDTSMALRFPLRSELVVRMVSAVFCPETNCLSDERLPIGIAQLSPPLTQHPADLGVVQRWIHNWKFATFYLQIKQNNKPNNL